MSSADRPGAVSLGVIVTDVLGRRRRDPGVGAWLGRVAPRSVTGAMGLVFASDAVMRRLNRQFAGAAHATDVLSFPTGDRREPVREEFPRLTHLYDETVHQGNYSRHHLAGWLGDVVIATGVSRRQARHAGHAWRTELRILALHGLLHLLGYDHGRDGGEMARLERTLRRKGGLACALIERARPRGVPASRAASSAPRSRTGG